MGFTQGDFVPVDLATFKERPFLERVEICAKQWVEYGFGTPKMVHMIYIVKLIVFYTIGGISLALWSSDIPAYFWEIDEWLFQPVVYQKMIIWTVLLEVMGIAGSWGPLAAHFKPMSGGIHAWLRPGTLRVAPWPDKVPFTAGDERTVGDVVLYVAILASLIYPLVFFGFDPDSAFLAGNERHVLMENGTYMLVPIALLALMGMRDTVVFLGARAEQYLPAFFFFAVLDPVDVVIALKVLIVVVWMGAGVSKFGLHFSKVVSPMVSNTPWLASKSLRRKMYRDFPNDLRPSEYTKTLAHLGGTTVELVLPVVLLFSTNATVTLLAVIGMVIFHLFIISTFPLAVPLEWNVLFALGTMVLFRGHPAQDGFALGDFSSVPVLLLIIAALVTFPILGNLKPQWVSFLPSMRQYAGNWASATWALAPGGIEKLDANLKKHSQDGLIQLQDPFYGYTEDEAYALLSMPLGWRGMHSQGPGLFSILFSYLGDDRMNTYTIREAEFMCNSIIGFNFGDGHFHDERMIAAIQKRCNFAPGEFVVAWVESQAIHEDFQRYRIIDAALGVVERGTYKTADSLNSQGWLPDGPIPLTVEWRAEVSARTEA